jgi:outer membrane protein TolC
MGWTRWSRRAALTAAAVFLAWTPSRSAHAQVVPAAGAVTALPAPLSLPQALAIALRRQPQRYLAQTSTTEALGRKQQAKAQYYPTLTPTYEFQNSSNALYGVPAQTYILPTTGTGTGTGGTGGTTVTLPTTASSTPNEVSIVRGGGLSIALSQTLFDSGQRELTNAQARRQVDAAKYGETDTTEQIILTVTQDYYDLLEAVDLVKVAQSQVGRFQQTLDITKAQVSAGTAAAIGVYQSQADLANAQVTLLQDQNSVSTASAALKNAMGVEVDGLVRPAPLAQGDQLPPLPPAGAPETFDADLKIAYADRADLRQQEADVQSSDAALKAAQIDAGLSVNATFDLTYQATNDVGYRGLDTQLLLSGAYPLFDAGSARGAIRTARGARDAAQDQLALIRQSIRESVEQAFSTRAETLQAARLAQAAVQAAQVNYDAALASRREGIDTVLDVTTAQATLTQAQVQYVTAIYSFYSADAALRRAIGTNDVAAGAAHP